MDLGDIARTLVTLGCPAEKSSEMAGQLERRARQLATEKGRTHEEALAHLIGLMAQGWAASGQSSSAPPVSSVRPWPTLSSKPIGDFRIFTMRSDVKRNPRTGAEHDFFVIDCVDWVSVIALTPDQQLVMVEQYRHGSD